MISFRQLVLALALLAVSSLGLGPAHWQQPRQPSYFSDEDLRALHDEAASRQAVSSALAEQLDRRMLEADALVGELTERLAGARMQEAAGRQQRPSELELADAVSQLLYTTQMDAPNEMKRRQDAPGLGYYFYDVNAHLPRGADWPPASATPRDQQTMSAPANDPEEFEAKLSELSNGLNHRLANTGDRQQLLADLLNHANESERIISQSNDLNSLDNFERARLLGELTKLLADQEASKQEREDLQRLEQRNYKQDNRQEDKQEPAGDDDGLESTTSARYGASEYTDPLALVGHQYVQGGAGEGRQLLGPDGTFENVQVIKTDAAIPSYCDPPNPCPIGFSARDGCLEDFVNSASFSREYQAHQKCSCDNEHSLFNCADPSSSSARTGSGDDSPAPAELSAENGDAADTKPRDVAAKLDVLVRTVQDHLDDLASVQKLISKQQAQVAGPGDQLNGLARKDDQDSNYLWRSARKLSSLDMHHKVDLD